jgi:hypothetical protein
LFFFFFEVRSLCQLGGVATQQRKQRAMGSRQRYDSCETAERQYLTMIAK